MDHDMPMDIDYLLTATRSARKSLDLAATVDAGDLRECLRIGLQAANGSNNQSWRWVVVQDPQLRGELARLYRDVYVEITGRELGDGREFSDKPFGRIMSSTEWLVEHLHEVPVHVIPCYQPYMPRRDGDESFQLATTYGSIFPPVWNFQLALHTRGYGTCITTMHLLREAEVRALLGIPESYVQGCLLPVGRLRAGKTFTPAPRRPLDEVVKLDGFDGPAL
jgi:nitroreductase